MSGTDEEEYLNELLDSIGVEVKNPKTRPKKTPDEIAEEKKERERLELSRKIKAMEDDDSDDVIVNFVDGEGDYAHASALAATFVCNAQPDFPYATAKATALKGLFFNTLDKVTIIIYQGMIFLFKPFELTFKLWMSIDRDFHAYSFSNSTRKSSARRPTCV